MVENIKGESFVQSLLTKLGMIDKHLILGGMIADKVLYLQPFLSVYPSFEFRWNWSN